MIMDDSKKVKRPPNAEIIEARTRQQSPKIKADFLVTDPDANGLERPSRRSVSISQ